MLKPRQLGAAIVLACGPFSLAAVAATDIEPKAAQPCAAAEECLAGLEAMKNTDRSNLPWTGLSIDGAARGLASRAVFLGGKTVFPRLAKLLSAYSSSVVDAATKALGAAGPAAVAAFPALARQLNVKRHSPSGDYYNEEIPWALDAIDAQRSIPLLKAACKRGHYAAAYYLRTQRPEIYREILASPDAAKAVAELMAPNGRGDHPLAFLQLASQNKKLPAALHKALAKAVADATPAAYTRDPASALAEIDRILADPELDHGDDQLLDPFWVVAHGRQAAMPLISRLAALVKNLSAVGARATWAMGEISDPAARSVLLGSLANRENWRVALLAANALGRQGAAAANAESALRRLATEHWHPAVRAMAKSAADAVSRKALALAPLANADAQERLGHSHYWGESSESLSDGFRCKPAASWGKSSSENSCQQPADIARISKCVLVHQLDKGWLRVDLPDDGMLNGRGEEEKVNLQFVPLRYESRKSILALKEGYFQGVTGKGTRAVVVESEFGRYSHDEIQGPGRTWLATYEQRGTAWVPLPSVELPSGLGSVERLPDGGLQLAFPNSQVVLRIAPDGQVVSGDCQPDPLAGTAPYVALLQAVVDAPTFGARLPAAGVELPLRVSFDFEPPAGADRLRFAGQPVVIEKNKSAIVAGRTFAVWSAEREVRRGDQRWVFEPTDIVSVAASYAAMQIEARFRLRQEEGVWKVLPPEPRPEERKATAETVTPAPPPADVKAPPRGALTTESGVSCKILAEAGDELYSGETPDPGALVTLEMTAWTSDGKPYFPLTGKSPVTVQLPLFMARAGLAEGISLMKTSEMRRLWIPARLVYLQPAADAKDLVIDVRLVSIARDEKEDVFPSEMADWERANRAPRDLASPPKSAQTTPSGLKFRVLKSGKHKVDALPRGETVSFSYKAWTKDGKLLDHAIVGEVHHGRDANNGAPPSLLIAGLAEALRLMRPGNQYRFWIPAELAHGNEPRVPNVPAGPIVVNIELIDP